MKQPEKPTRGPSSVSGVSPLAIRPDYDALKDRFGITKADIRKAELAARYVAIYIIWEKGSDHCMIGTTVSPTERPAQAQFYNRRDVCDLLLWTPGQEIADRIIGLIRHEAKPHMTRPGEVHYAIRHDRMEGAVRAVASKCGVTLFDTVERSRRLVEAATRYSQHQMQLEKANNPAAVRASAKVIALADHR